MAKKNYSLCMLVVILSGGLELWRRAERVEKANYPRRPRAGGSAKTAFSVLLSLEMCYTKCRAAAKKAQAQPVWHCEILARRTDNPTAFGLNATAFALMAIAFKLFAIAFGPLAIDFEPLAIAFKPFAIAFNPLTIAFAPIAIAFGLIAIDFMSLAIEFNLFAIALMALVIAFKPGAIVFIFKSITCHQKSWAERPSHLGLEFKL